ncbi:HEPN domain-containing protein [Hymenobacter sp. ASUV-10]|uniref:HEPN domain-containing protein n=1 Tax=Hymenobacter aranciens TaxID=3063996 RepID=A0ABT9BFZ4_9BACT|nr:HEPN domain-containing protein [Hymenobacter sp. ASUV-10]MDO7875576.1 HEPN domain-containing protein [Hymenobacter sp. ASUV-10]
MLATADNDMGMAQVLLQNAAHYYEGIGFHCQQAVEKYLKAMLVTYGLTVPYTHDLPRLLNDLTPFIVFTADERLAAVALFDFAVDFRYELDDAPSYTSADLLDMAGLFQARLRPLAQAFLI